MTSVASEVNRENGRGFCREIHKMKSLNQTDLGIFNIAVCKELGELQRKGVILGQSIIKDEDGL